MPSPELPIISSGLFRELDEQQKKFCLRKSEVEVKQRYEQILKNEWPALDCRLDGVSDSDLEAAIKNHRKATALLMSVDLSALSLDIVRNVHAKMSSQVSEQSGVFRTTAVAPLAENHVPTEPAGIDSALRNLFEWTTADSFAELHPVQQSALVLIRLLDIHPFLCATQRTSRVLSNWYLMKAGFPPVIIAEEEWSAYRQAVRAAFAMNTTLLTATFTRCLGKTFERCLKEE